MESKELRIGNLLKYDDGTIVEVLTVSSRDIVVKRFPQPLNISVLHPIPLTPEILEKAGWYWNAECNSYEHADIRMNMQFREVNQSWTMYNHVLKAVIAKRIYHVHQLQNLYFALTGEELEINLT